MQPRLDIHRQENLSSVGHLPQLSQQGQAPRTISGDPMSDLLICPGAAQFGCTEKECGHAAPHLRIDSCQYACKYKGGESKGCVCSTLNTYSKFEMPQVRGMRSLNFKRLNEGFLGTLSRHGKTIVIVLDMHSEQKAETAEDYICGER